MSCKSFSICVVLNILDVTCPGVWICPKGMIYLDIWLFGCNNSTSYVEPKFPLVFNEKFNFHKTFAELSNLRDIQKVLEEKCMRIALVQAYKKKQVTLATYSSYVDEVLYPERSRLSKNGELALLMKNEPLFPGTISPKITLITKTSVTEQINVISCANHSSPQYLETPNQPNRMKRVHHSKTINSPCSQKTENRTINNDKNNNSDTDTDSQLYCLRRIKTNNNITDLESRSKKSCKHCEDVNGSKINEHIKETSDRKIIKESLNLKHKSLDNDECKNTGITSNKFRKNIKAKFNVGAHHYKCCKSKLNNSSSTIESINTSDEDPKYEEKNTNIPVILEKSDEEPKKINPKIKARLHLDVYSCKCGMPGCMLSPSWRNICNEINRKDTVGDAVKYQISLRNYYKRLYEETTNQLGRNLQLL
ncbi:spermatogenesis-associated protein 6 isoform X1 [Rhopalosiphum maidis]|uniref:spermatogenesis-associated protein 6 isoform X1 n=1 Tax=Rhopalosiphum maidis TaxID=43146 RepID=UPI000F0017FF|nr:spermatogenesis-associated protein 6 isoform X1 [Rhopalosiphum maidis]